MCTIFATPSPSPLATSGARRAKESLRFARLAVPALPSTGYEPCRMAVIPPLRGIVAMFLAIAGRQKLPRAQSPQKRRGPGVKGGGVLPARGQRCLAVTTAARSRSPARNVKRCTSGGSSGVETGRFGVGAWEGKRPRKPLRLKAFAAFCGARRFQPFLVRISPPPLW